MTSTVLRWWPPLAAVFLVALGLVVGGGSTALDDQFSALGRAHRRVAHLLLRFTDPRLLVALLAVAALLAAARRQWRLLVIVVLTPGLAAAVARLLKLLFDRQRGGALAYPSGHVTVTVTVLGMLVLALGAHAWALAAAAAYVPFAMAGQALTYHYFTDTLGGLALGTALVCLAALATRAPARAVRART